MFASPKPMPSLFHRPSSHAAVFRLAGLGKRGVQLSQRLARCLFEVRELDRDRLLDVCHDGTSMPETEDETVKRVLDGVVAAIDRQQ